MLFKWFLRNQELVCVEWLNPGEIFSSSLSAHILEKSISSTEVHIQINLVYILHWALTLKNNHNSFQTRIWCISRGEEEKDTKQNKNAPNISDLLQKVPIAFTWRLYYPYTPLIGLSSGPQGVLSSQQQQRLQELVRNVHSQAPP